MRRHKHEHRGKITISVTVTSDSNEASFQYMGMLRDLLESPENVLPDGISFAYWTQQFDELSPR